MNINQKLIDFLRKEAEKDELEDGNCTHRGLTCMVCERQVIINKLCFKCLRRLESAMIYWNILDIWYAKKQIHYYDLQEKTYEKLKDN